MKTVMFDLIKNEDGKWSLFLFSEGEKIFPIWAKTNLFLDIALDYVKKLDAGVNLIEEEPSDLSSHELLDTYSSISVDQSYLFTENKEWSMRVGELLAHEYLRIKQTYDEHLTREDREQGNKELGANVISVETIDLFGMGPCISFAPSDSLDNEQTGRFLTFYKNEKHELNI